MTSFDTSPQPAVRRALLALVVVFVMLATTGWTALRNQREATPLQASLSAWEKGRIAGHRLPDPRSAPERLARFFASLSEGQRTALARRYPLAVGNMNGAPVSLRYRANRIALGKALGIERERVHDSRLTPAGQRQAARRTDRFEALLRPGRHILAFDPSGPGRVAEVLGDLRTAERVSVVVPGADTDLLTFQRTHRRYAAPVGMARSLYAAEREADPTTRTAVIAWADYTAPSGLGMDAATAMRAEDGAVRLNAMLRGLPGNAPVSLFCHSYGSVVCGLRRARAAGPGDRHSGGRQPRDAGREGVPTGHLRPGVGDAGRRRLDRGRAVPGVRRPGARGRPVAAGFGARVLSAREAEGHSGYFVPGTDSLRNFAEIGVGAYRAVSCAREDDACRAGLSGTGGHGRA
ncbi:Alpha/beta hydrolase OS=Streptomyces griseomycini OX=66895 GN=FHS37_000598 PE=4 SV=1 [Streptomyces griseomycini]